MGALAAAGFTADEIKTELEILNYNEFKDEGLLDKIGFIGKGLSIGFEYGIYEGDYFEEWLEGLLQRKGITKFGDLIIDEYKDDQKYKYKLQIIASDITDRKLLVLPTDLKEFGLDPDSFVISRAVRMSMSIPIFFEPVKLQDAGGRTHYIVDGGALSNYPIWLLDDGKKNPPWPTFGFKLMEHDERTLKKGSRNPINSPLSFLKAIISTMMEAHDTYHISKTKGDYDRTIGIPTVLDISGRKREIKATDFGISQYESNALFLNGQKAAKKFLKNWNFETWKKKYREKKKK